MKVINVYEYKPIECLDLQTFNKTFSCEFKNSKSSSELLVKSNQPRTNTKSIIKNNRPSTAIIGNRTKGAFSNGKQYHKKSRYSKAKGDRRETYKMDICAYNSKLISECLQDIKEVNNSLHIYPFKLANCGIQTKYNNKFRQQSIGTNTNNEYGNRKDSKAKSLLQAKNCHSKSCDENYVKKKCIVINPLNVVNISKKMFPKHNKLNLHFNRQKISNLKSKKQVYIAKIKNMMLFFDGNKNKNQGNQDYLKQSALESKPSQQKKKKMVNINLNCDGAFISPDQIASDTEDNQSFIYEI